MRRREFIAGLGGAAAMPFSARAQQPDRMRRLGVLVGVASQTDPEGQARVGAFLKEFQTFGWTPGRNVQIDIRWSAQDTALVRAQAAELVSVLPDAIYDWDPIRAEH